MRYKFRYINGMYKTASKIIGPLQNIFLVWAIYLAVYFLVGKIAKAFNLEDYVLNADLMSILHRIVLAASLLWAMAYTFLRKGVYLQENCLVIAHYTVSLTNWHNRIIINYDDIESVNDNFHDLHFTKHRYSMVVPCGDESYNIELTLKSGKKYFFSIENQEEFCENLTFLINNR